MHPTAKRLRQRLDAVFDHAIGRGLREAPNPIDGALRRSLPKGKHKAKHHAALSWREVPSFMGELEEREAIAALCLRFIILTAARSGEARMATWHEVDLNQKTWIIPASRMKVGYSQPSRRAGMVGVGRLRRCCDRRHQGRAFAVDLSLRNVAFFA
jgi:integrase|tara:strand:+ start:521 stop:988 length:468 start_codon:yes stop_codon:yes gene_type:complete